MSRMMRSTPFWNTSRLKCSNLCSSAADQVQGRCLPAFRLLDIQTHSSSWCWQCTWAGCKLLLMLQLGACTHSGG